VDIVFLLVPASIFLALLALAAFIWSARSGQFKDLDTPGKRLLSDDVEQKTQERSDEA
jgi:cbb3-type cytochrome oxidase maturation protein